jgi:hypothetical protein
MQSKVRIFSAALAIAVAGGLAAAAISRAETAAPSTVYTADGKLVFPKDYRTWVYLSSGMDMAYVEAPGASDQHLFDNVFVNPEAYAAFQKTGSWPQKTIFMLEVRKGQGRGSINRKGLFQTDVLGVEAHVKDARFKSGWAFFPFNSQQAPSQAFPQNSACNACHEAHAAVDTTFVQFYPTLLPTAEKMKLFSAAYLAEEQKAKAESR